MPKPINECERAPSAEIASPLAQNRWGQGQRGRSFKRRHFGRFERLAREAGDVCRGVSYSSICAWTRSGKPWANASPREKCLKLSEPRPMSKCLSDLSAPRARRGRHPPPGRECPGRGWPRASYPAHSTCLLFFLSDKMRLHAAPGTKAL